MFLKIAGVSILVLGVALAATVTALKAAWQDVAELETRYEEQQAETRKALEQIGDLKAQHAEQIAETDALLRERAAENTRLRAASQKLRATTDSLTAALNREPARAGRVASYLFARGMRDICRESGGSPESCKIAVPKSSASRSGDSTSSPVGPGDGMEGERRARQ